jgi:hypothetical protein
LCFFGVAGTPNRDLELDVTEANMRHFRQSIGLWRTPISSSSFDSSMRVTVISFVLIIDFRQSQRQCR